MNRVLLLLIATGLLVADVCAAHDRNAIHASAEEAQPLLPGMQAPSFTVRTVADEPFEFDPAGMTRPIILTFYRGGWCPYCNLQLAEYRHAEAELREMDFEVWFISVDRPAVLQDSLQEPDLGYTLFSDSKLEATRAFGIAFRVDDATIERYLGFGLDLREYSGESHQVLPVPSTFIIGTDGVIRFSYSNPDYKVRLHPDVLLAAARAYRADADQRLIRAREAQQAAEGG